MKLPFDLLEQVGHAVERQSRAQTAEIARHDSEGRPRPGVPSARQATTEGLVDDLAKRPPGAARLRPELLGHVVVQSQGCPHALMLVRRHHDVNDLNHAVDDDEADGRMWLTSRWHPL